MARTRAGVHGTPHRLARRPARAGPRHAAARRLARTHGDLHRRLRRDRLGRARAGGAEDDPPAAGRAPRREPASRRRSRASSSSPCTTGPTTRAARTATRRSRPTTLARADYTIQAGDQHEAFFAGVREALAASELGPWTSQVEWGLGQWEINLEHRNRARDGRPAHPVQARDARPRRRRRDGGHVHGEAVRRHDRARRATCTCRSSTATGANVFHDADAGDGIVGVAARARSAACSSDAPDLMLFYAPTVNSYRRTTSGEFCGNGALVGLRQPDGLVPRARRVGRRRPGSSGACAGADANPYLAIAARARLGRRRDRERDRARRAADGPRLRPAGAAAARDARRGRRPPSATARSRPMRSARTSSRTTRRPAGGSGSSSSRRRRRPSGSGAATSRSSDRRARRPRGRTARRLPRSSMNCEGLMQIVVNPRASCAGIDASASPRSATPSASGNRPRVPPTISSSNGSRPAARIAGSQPLEILVARRAERVEAAPELDQPSEEPLVHPLAAEPQRRPARTETASARGTRPRSDSAGPRTTRASRRHRTRHAARCSSRSSPTSSRTARRAPRTRAGASSPSAGRPGDPRRADRASRAASRAARDGEAAR